MRSGRPPDPWRQWLTSFEPKVRETWIKAFRSATPALCVRMAEAFFDRLHGTAKQTMEHTGKATLEIVITE